MMRKQIGVRAKTQTNAPKMHFKFYGATTSIILTSKIRLRVSIRRRGNKNARVLCVFGAWGEVYCVCVCVCVLVHAFTCIHSYLCFCVCVLYCVCDFICVCLHSYTYTCYIFIYNLRFQVVTNNAIQTAHPPLPQAETGKRSHFHKAWKKTPIRSKLTRPEIF